MFICVGFEPWYQQHRGIAVFRDALKKSFPNHDITCKLLCTTEECKEYQLPHTDNRKYTCRFIDKSMHICLCKDGHATCDRDQFKMSRDTCPFTVFLAVETCTALAIGDGFGLESNSSWLINPRDNKIEMNNGLLISGSTPHAGVPFPSRKSCGCRRRKPGPRAHYRIFFDGSPNQKNCPYWPDPRAPQWKLSTGVEIESK